jgi:hypothetical protein
MHVFVLDTLNLHMDHDIDPRTGYYHGQRET